MKYWKYNTEALSDQKPIDEIVKYSKLSLEEIYELRGKLSKLARQTLSEQAKS